MRLVSFDLGFLAHLHGTAPSCLPYLGHVNTRFWQHMACGLLPKGGRDRCDTLQLAKVTILDTWSSTTQP